MTKTSAGYNEITILQSLESGRTGSRLYEDLNQMVLQTNGLVRVRLFDIDCTKDLLNVLEQIRIDILRDDLAPLLHFETHGTEDKSGLVLSSDEFVPWATLKAPLTTINDASRMNLFICLSACNGAGLTKIINPTDRSPCWGMVGPIDIMYPDDLLCDYTAFYQELLTTKDGWAAVARLNRGDINKGPYLFTTAEWFFRQTWAAYVRDHCSPVMLKERAYKMIRRLKKYGKRTYMNRNDMMDEMLVHEKRYFRHAVQRFFMIDKYPEVASRIKVDYRDYQEEIGAMKTV